MALNQVCLVGRLTRDVVMKYTPQGVAIASFGLAVDRVTKNDAGDYDVDFFNVTAWRKTAEFASSYLGKGRLVSVAGRLQSRSWVVEASGEKRNAVEIVAESLQGLDKRPDANADQHTSSSPAKKDAGAEQAVEEGDPFAEE